MSAITNKRIENLYDEMQNRAIEYVKAYNDRKSTKKELKSLKKLATDKMDTYNLELSKETYKEWAENGGNAVETGIKTRFVPGCKRVRFPTNDNDVMSVEFVERKYPVNLPQMMATLGAGAFASPDWFKLVEKFAYLMANNLNKMLADSVTFKYQIEEASQAFSIDGVDLDAIAWRSAIIQKIFDSILFIPDESGNNTIRATICQDNYGRDVVREWEYITNAMTRDGELGKGELVVGGTGKMTEYIANAMHNNMTGEAFGLVVDAE